MRIFKNYMLAGTCIAASVLAATVALADQTFAATATPLKGVPLLYDANNKLIGPYVDTVIVPIKGQYVALHADQSGFVESNGPYGPNGYVQFFYTNKTCTSKRYLYASGLISSGSILDGVIYFPGVGGTPTKIYSYQYPDYSQPNHPLTCSDFGGTPQTINVAPAVSTSVTSLGFTAPFSLRAP